jgi:GNAT superfamily N-acetyltransferase
MNIIKAKPDELIEAFYLLKAYLKEMRSKGWLYRDLGFESLSKEIENGTVFLYRTDFLSLGFIILSKDELLEYKNVTWADSKNPLTVRYLIDHPIWRKQGISDHLLMFAEEFARDQGFTSLRLDVYGNNQEILSLFASSNFNQAGQIQISEQKIPFYCFEKTF